MPVFRSRDLSRPIRCQYSGHVICLDQSEVSITCLSHWKPGGQSPSLSPYSCSILAQWQGWGENALLEPRAYSSTGELGEVICVVFMTTDDDWPDSAGDVLNRLSVRHDDPGRPLQSQPRQVGVGPVPDISIILSLSWSSLFVEILSEVNSS